jgi:hypothetical protein
MQDVKWSTAGPREAQLAVAGDSAVDCKAVQALQHPIGNVTTAVWPKEAESDAVKGFIDTHVACSGCSMVCGESVMTKWGRDNNQHEELFVVLNRLEHNQFVVHERNVIMTDIIAIRGMK